MPEPTRGLCMDTSGGDGFWETLIGQLSSGGFGLFLDSGRHVAVH